jgi:hypothetical protein
MRNAVQAFRETRARLAEQFEEHRAHVSVVASDAGVGERRRR